MKAIALRLMPDMDLRQSLLDYCIEHAIDAACIVSCVGSLRCANIRFAGCAESIAFNEKLEIISLVGTVSRHGCHLHIAVANGQGQILGGHLLHGAHIYTTAEVLLGIIPDMILRRVHDDITGFKELKIEDDRLE